MVPLEPVPDDLLGTNVLVQPGSLDGHRGVVRQGGEQVEIADGINKSMELYEGGNEKEAAKVLRRTKKKLKSRQAKYDFADSPAYDRAAGTLSELEKQVDSAPASSPAGNRARKKAGKKSYDVLRSVNAF